MKRDFVGVHLHRYIPYGKETPTKNEAEIGCTRPIRGTYNKNNDTEQQQATIKTKATNGTTITTLTKTRTAT